MVKEKRYSNKYNDVFNDYLQSVRKLRSHYIKFISHVVRRLLVAGGCNLNLEFLITNSLKDYIISHITLTYIEIHIRRVWQADVFFSASRPQ